MSQCRDVEEGCIVNHFVRGYLPQCHAILIFSQMSDRLVQQLRLLVWFMKKFEDAYLTVELLCCLLFVVQLLTVMQPLSSACIFWDCPFRASFLACILLLNYFGVLFKRAKKRGYGATIMRFRD